MGKWIDFVRQVMHAGTKCIYCERELPEGELVCAECAREEDELRNQDGFAGGILYAYRYGGVVRTLVHRLKYNDSPHCSLFMAQRMAEFLGGYEVNADAVTFVPMHKKRRRTRGYDQSELLARHLGMLLNIACETMLVRGRETRPQYKLGAQQRWRNVHDAFILAEGAQPGGKNILLIDDVFTTGATVGECMKVLADAGANVMVFTYAKEFPQTEKRIGFPRI